MKNVLFIAAFALGGVIGIGQATNPQNREITEQMDPSQDGYTEVNLEDLTEDITISLGKYYPKTNIDKAFWNEKNQKYKLEVSKDGGETATLYVDKEGNFGN